MAFNWLAAGAKMAWDANAVIPGTDRHIKNWIMQQSTQNGEETHIADIGNGRTVTVTIKDVIRASGCEKWDVTGVRSDGTTAHMVVEKSVQKNKMKVAEDVVRKLI